jgi:glycosyltransferase involved in cell wall biosynthesis
MSRGGQNPIREIQVIRRTIGAYRRFRPDLVHQVGIKPVLYGSWAARLAGGPAAINAMGGLGYTFVAQGGLAEVRRRAAQFGFRLLINRPRNRMILQNQDDIDKMVRAGVSPANIRMIAGSGVNLEEFYPGPERPGPPVVMLASRMLWDKGVGEFARAAAILKERGVRARFVLVGDPDPENPMTVDQKQLDAWAASGVVECWGRRSDMPEVLRQADVFCHPSYREGLPKAMLEAAASGLPTVATDTPGCRDALDPGRTGLLTPVRDAEALADALGRLIDHPDQRRQMGRAARDWAHRFSLDQVIERTLALYREVLE